MMKRRKILVRILLAYTLFISACVYVVLPEDLEPVGDGTAIELWSALITGVETSTSGDLHIDIAIRNDTGDWSAMQAVEGKPAILTTSDGKTTDCDTVFIGTGGHRLAPGFQARGFTTGTKDDPQIQPLYVECKGAVISKGARLSIDYVSFTGILDDYDPQANKTEEVLELGLDDVVADLSYPIGSPVEGLVQPAGEGITGLSDNIVTLVDVQRGETGLQFTWENFNPTKFPLKTHIGTPPVIGSDGIIYGPFETLDMAPIPITPPNEKVEWTTDVTVPADVQDFYILLSVESKKPRTYLNYVLDITDK
ncbi:MAG TPA: hypothetical protein VFY25_06675 [Anaerolineales bacterium]|nr:hypothetical protein [Anaerolineales bacterium]